MASLVLLCGIHQSFIIIPRFTFLMRSWYNSDRQDRTSKFTKTIWGFRSIKVYSFGMLPPFFGVTWMNNSPLECPHASRACLFSMPYWILCATAGSNFKKGPSYVQDSQGAKNVFLKWEQLDQICSWDRTDTICLHSGTLTKNSKMQMQRYVFQSYRF